MQGLMLANPSDHSREMKSENLFLEGNLDGRQLSALNPPNDDNCFVRILTVYDNQHSRKRNN